MLETSKRRPMSQCLLGRVIFQNERCCGEDKDNKIFNTLSIKLYKFVQAYELIDAFVA